MRFYVGTSGFSYKEWKGTFYPERIAARDMLSHYSRRLPAVEINNTFYRMPNRSVLETWASQVPEGFRFVLKASQRITHRKRLREAQEDARHLWSVARVLDEKLGGILFQLPPTFRKDLERLTGFLDGLPEPSHAAFEFRHRSWLDDEVLAALRAKGAALCVADTGDAGDAGDGGAVDGGDRDDAAGALGANRWGYLRLRKETYSQEELSVWARRIKSQPWKVAYVFFKHEDDAAGPEMAARFLELLRT